MEEKLKILEGIDSYLPHVDGVINCMNNYCLNSYENNDILAIAPRYKGHTDNLVYPIKRCRSLYLPILNIQYGRATFDRKFKKEIMAMDFDIVHINSPFNMLKFGLYVARKKNIPAVTTFHSNMRPIFVQVMKSKKLAEFFVKRLGKTYNKYDEVFVCSPLVAEQCRSFGYTGKISYLPFGTDLEKCENKAELRAEANKEFGFAEDELFFIYVGRIEKLKRIDFILDSLKSLKDKGIKFRFWAVGKGSDMHEMEKYRDKLGFTDNEVHFTGFIDAKLFPLIYARGDLLIFPSLYDNFGLVKVEAAAYSTPGIFIENSCAGYGVTDGVNGYLAPDDVTAFARRIEKALADKNELKTVGENAGRDLYISWKDCTDQFIERLHEVVRRYNNEHKK